MGYPWDKEKLQLTKDFIWSSNKPIDKEWSNWNKSIIIKINGDIWVRNKFIWDGCTSVPSGRPLTEKELEDVPVITLTENPVPVTWKASLIHDVICKETNKYPDEFPYSRDDGDNFFYKLLNECGFKRSRLYYKAVSFFGDIIVFVKKHFS